MHLEEGRNHWSPVRGAPAKQERTPWPLQRVWFGQKSTQIETSKKPVCHHLAAGPLARQLPSLGPVLGKERLNWIQYSLWFPTISPSKWNLPSSTLWLGALFERWGCNLKCLNVCFSLPILIIDSLLILIPLCSNHSLNSLNKTKWQQWPDQQRCVKENEVSRSEGL